VHALGTSVETLGSATAKFCLVAALAIKTRNYCVCNLLN
jgi:hypothetical protein